jgi:hypothetical protein
MPNSVLGGVYGAIAAREAEAVGLPDGVNLWCDLEGVSANAKASDVIAFCNEWYAAAVRFGFDPGLYVGDSCGLTAQQLYRDLRFKRYWSAYNLNRENFPAVRGVQIRQRPYPAPGLRVPGCPFEYDEDQIQTDALGGTPVLVVT